MALVLTQPQVVDADVAAWIEILHGVDELQECQPGGVVCGSRDEGQVVVQLLHVFEVSRVVFLRALRHVFEEPLAPLL